MFLAGLFGLFAASYLLYTYTTGADLRCGLLSGCDVVRASSWSSWFGIPTPAFGVAFYLAMLTLLIVRVNLPQLKPSWLRWMVFAMAAAGFAESVFLTSIQLFELKTFCTWCLASAAAATIIFLAACFDRTLQMDKERTLKEMMFYFTAMTVFAVVGGISFFLLTRPVQTDTARLAPSQSQTDDRIGAEGSVTDTSASPTEPSTADLEVVGKFTPVEGPATAKVTLVEFMDFQCPACGVYHELVMLPLRAKYAGKVRFAQRQFPLADLHPQAVGAAVAGICAHQQGRYFAYSDKLYANQKNLFRINLSAYASEIGLDMKRFEGCLDDPSALELVLQDREAGLGFGIQGTPTIILNDAIIEGTPNLESMSRLIDERLKD